MLQSGCVILITEEVDFCPCSLPALVLYCSRLTLEAKRSQCLPFPAVNVSVRVTRDDKVIETQGRMTCGCVNAQLAQTHTKMDMVVGDYPNIAPPQMLCE